MNRGCFIGLDTHCQFTEVAVVDPAGRILERRQCVTTIPDLVKVMEALPRPRRVTLEESSLADWLWRNLRLHVEEVTVCEPRRNRLIAQDGEKEDDIDAEKLAQLLRGGFVKAVHHPQTQEQSAFKQHVNLYHARVRHRVREAHAISALLKRQGIMAKERDFLRAEDRAALLERVPAGILREDLESLWQGYDQMMQLQEIFRQRLVKRARQEDVVTRMESLPGLGWIRSATLYAYLDTPWRFRGKKALWSYLGIGLERRGSGNGPRRLGVPRNVHRLLKSTILGAAKSAIAQGKNPFADQARRWQEQGLSPRLVRRNVARSLSAVLWGLWKSGQVYRSEWVGVALAASSGKG